MDDIKFAFGRRIKELRLSKKLSQEGLANLADMDRTYVASVENGKRNVSIKNVEKICNALEISIPMFFDNEVFK